MEKIAYPLLILVVLVTTSCKNESKQALPEVTEQKENTTDTISKTQEPPKKTVKQIKDELARKGFKTFYYIDQTTKDTILMQQYFIALLKSGPIHSQNEEEVEMLQQEHDAYLNKMHQLGYTDISGPSTNASSLHGIAIYNVPTLKMADSLANADPMVKSGRLQVEIYPWWAAKGSSLR